MNLVTHNRPTFSIAEYERMIESGVFEQRTDHIELIDGELVMMAPVSDAHDDLILYLTDWSRHAMGDQYQLAVQIGLQLLESESLPEPDLFWVGASHRRGRPTSKEVALVIEVALTSLDIDSTTKQHLYASEGIPEYWVVDSESETVIVHRKPLPKRYASVQTSGLGQVIAPLCRPDQHLDLTSLFRE